MGLPSASAEPGSLQRQGRECHWYRGPIVWGRPGDVLSFARRQGGGLRQTSSVLALAAAVLVSGCGGGSAQNAHEVAGTFDVQVLKASFPAKQAVARPASLMLRVKNTGSRTVPN